MNLDTLVNTIVGSGIIALVILFVNWKLIGLHRSNLTLAFGQFKSKVYREAVVSWMKNKDKKSEFFRNYKDDDDNVKLRIELLHIEETMLPMLFDIRHLDLAYDQAMMSSVIGAIRGNIVVRGYVFERHEQFPLLIALLKLQRDGQYVFK